MSAREGEIRARVKGRVPVDPDRHLTLEHVDLVGADFSGRRLDSFLAVEGRFTGCRFEDMRVENWVTGSGQKPSMYVDCVFDGSRIRFNPGGLARFERCSFRNVELRDWMSFETELVDCVFTGTMRRSFFNGRPGSHARPGLNRERNEFRGNDFSGMEFIDVGFRTGVDLRLQHLPPGEQYVYLKDAGPALDRARDLVVASGAVKLVGEHGDRVPVIDYYRETVQEGQKQILVSRNDYRRKSPQEMDVIFNALEAVS